VGLGSGRHCPMRRLILARNCSHGDCQTVPCIASHHGVGQVDELGFGELLFHRFIDFVGYVGLRDEGDRFGPFEGGAFFGGVVGSLSPGIQAVEALFGFSLGAHLDHMNEGFAQ
jgi:hypothetical protein